MQYILSILKNLTMVINNINIFTLISKTENFGINTNIFETNILNLAVVIGVLIYYGRSAFSIRNFPKLMKLEDADTKFLEAQESLKMALKSLESAEIQAEKIRAQGITLSNQTAKSLLDSVEEDIKRLEKLNIATVLFEEQKSVKEVCQKLWKLASKRAILIIKKRIRSLEPKVKKAFYKNKLKRYAKKLSRFRGQFVRRKRSKR
uniref:ATP synthase CF0 subunit I n=1 Tax=Colacium mucronatum TaxID=167756 RepID=UPI0023AB3B33|nr:ATP synthase CF0 subunit I [Colacium mucronatum]WCH63256.1 ATP synthase CF0 subunit I [Colacium mucronatum]